MIHLSAESHQNVNIDKDTTLPASARTVKTSGLKVRSFSMSASVLGWDSSVHARLLWVSCFRLLTDSRLSVASALSAAFSVCIHRLGESGVRLRHWPSKPGILMQDVDILTARLPLFTTSYLLLV